MTTGPAVTGGDWRTAGPVHHGYNWRDDATCRRQDPDLWFSAKHRGEALHVCLTHCPVLAQCQQFAEQLRPAPTDCVMGGVAWRMYADRITDTSARPPVVAFCRLCLRRPA